MRYDESIIQKLIEKNVFYLEPFTLALKKQYSFFAIKDDYLGIKDSIVPKPKL